MTRWIILRASGAQTLPLMRSLRAAGLDVWTPARTIRKVIGAHTRKGARMIEIEAPILPTFVFAREADLGTLARAAGLSISPHPGFSIFRHGGRVPLVGDGDVAGLKAEEERAAVAIKAMRDADTREEAERIRIAALKTEAARRRATREMERDRVAGLRAQRRVFQEGAEVQVDEMPALVGVTGVVEAYDGTWAEVRFGSQSWKIEGWRLLPVDLSSIAA